jgi:type IV pilus assembly protein PilV
MEVLLAMLILSVGLLGMAALITGIINSNKLSNRISTATVLAQDKMEDIRRKGYDGVGDIGDPDEDENPVTGYSKFRRVTSIKGVGTPAVSGLKSITVTVSWDSNAHSVELKTILAQ